MPVTLHFIRTDLTRRKAERSRSERSHAARIGRQNGKKHLIPGHAKQWQPYDNLKDRASHEAHEPSVHGLDLEPVATKRSEPAASTGEADSRSQDDEHGVRPLPDKSAMLAFLPRTVAPLFGALVIESFSLEQSVTAAEIGRYIFERILSISVAPRERSDWFAAWCKQPLVYHTLCYAGMFMRRGTSVPKLMHHHIKIVQLANKQLASTDKLGKSELAGLIMALTSLWGMNFDAKATEWHASDETSLFKKQTAEDFMAYATSHNHHDDLHMPALVYLIEKVGGLHAMPFLRGMGSSIAFSDLIQATTEVRKPRFKSYWEAQASAQATISIVSPPCTIDNADAFDHVPGGLTLYMVETLIWLRAFNQRLSMSASRTEDAEYVVYQTRNAIQHRLVSLPTWSELHDPSETEGCHRAIYEVCRLTTLLYATEIFMAIGRRDLWQAKLLRQLLDVVEMANLLMWRDRKASELLVWSLMIGSIAAWWTSLRDDFCRALTQAVQAVELNTLAEAEQLFEAYLWMDAACGPGAALIWESLSGYRIAQ